MADAIPPAGVAGASPEGTGPAKTGQDDLDPSILAAMGQANADLKPSAAPAAEAGSKDFMDQSAIDALLNQAAFDDPQAGAKATGGGVGGGATDDDIEKMLASAASEVTKGAAKAAAPAAPRFDLPSFSGAAGEASQSSIDLLRDVELNVKIELGRSRMLVEDVLKLGEGSVVELDKLAGDPVDVFVNDRLVARGEVLVLNDNFCVRVNEIVAGLRDDVL